MATTEPFIGNLVSGTWGTWKNSTIVPVRTQHRAQNSFEFSTGCTFCETKLFPLVSLKLSLLPCSLLFLYIIHEKYFSSDLLVILTRPSSCLSPLRFLPFSLFTVNKQPHPCPALRFLCLSWDSSYLWLLCVLPYSSPALQHTKPSRRGCVVFSCLTSCGFGLFDFILFQVLETGAGQICKEATRTWLPAHIFPL